MATATEWYQVLALVSVAYGVSRRDAADRLTAYRERTGLSLAAIADRVSAGAVDVEAAIAGASYGLA